MYAPSLEAIDKLRLLGQQADIEPAEEVSLTGEKPPLTLDCDALPGMIHYAATPRGPVALLKGMVTSACERNCLYCPFRAGRDYRRATFTPDELAATFDQMVRAGLVEGLFLSSGLVGSGPRTQDRIIATAEILRERYQFRGYLHLKVMPGAELEQVRRTMQLADRVSVNLEAPNRERLAALAPRKEFFDELVRPLQLVEQIRREIGGRPGTWENLRRSGPSLTTQYVVGPAGESDVELLETTAYLHRDLGLARAYFSRFNPIADTPLEDHPPESPRREHRLYQASFLLRDYGFDVQDLIYDVQDHLPQDIDPKLAWAQVHLAERPLELNTAGRRDLLRVPGIGPRYADRLIKARRLGLLRDLGDLRDLGIPTGRLAPFVLLDGRRPPHQLRLL